MASDFEELDFRATALGDLVLRRRLEPRMGVQVFEVKLGEAFLMSSLFTRGEEALAELGLAARGESASPLDVVVGGLGLGYTARAVLDQPRVGSLLVVEALAPVIDWHRAGLVPLGRGISADARCKLAAGDFFALARAGTFDASAPGRRFDAILVDIDHSPRHLLDPSHASLYAPEGLRQLAAQLVAEGVFALWSNDPPDTQFMAVLHGAFTRAEARVVAFDNPLQGRAAQNTVYVAACPR